MSKNPVSKRKRLKAMADALKEKCARCGITDKRVLDYHHTDPTNKERGVREIYHGNGSVRNLLKEIAKCEVLCANCHRIEESERRSERKS